MWLVLKNLIFAILVPGFVSGWLPVNIAGGAFTFRYNFHPIPTLGFDVTYQGKSVAYSGDHLNDRNQLTALHEIGLLSRKRLEGLLDFRWDADLILHEAGVRAARR